jgi:hypothetical protein
MYHRLRNHFGYTQCYSLVMRVKWKLILVYLENVLILTHDRCTVSAERTIGLKFDLATPDGTAR